MAHHGNRHLRISRVTKRTNRSTAGHDDAHHDHGEPVAIHGTVVHNAKDKKRQAQDAAQAETATAASEEIREPVQATASISEDLQATSDSTAAMSPDANSASESVVPETATDQSSVAVTATTSEDSATASPASSTPAADTASATTSPEPSSTPTSISIISSVSIIGSSQTPLSLNTSISTPLASSTAVSNTTASSTSSITQSTSSSSSSSSSTSSSSTTSSTSSTSSTVTSTDSTTSEFSAVTSISGSGDGDAGTYFWGGGSQATATGQVTLTMGSTPSATGSASQSSNALDSQTKGKIAGGVVGGVAGAMVLVLVAVLLLRRRRTNQHRASQVLPPGDMTGTAVGAASVTRSTDMVSRRSSNDPLFTASYFAPAFMKRWRQSRLSTHTESTLDSSASERGFQKISGRKIPSVLQSGGDGYGGGLSEGSPTVSEPSMSFSPTSPVLPRSPTSQPPPSVPYGMPLDASYTRETEEADPIVIFRPSPARTPVPGSAAASLTNEPSVSRAIQVSQGVLSPTMPRRPDVLGRSHPSFDGSRGSRFTESI